MQTSIPRVKGEPWAEIDDAIVSCSPQKAKVDDSLAITVNFKLKGG